MAKCMSCGKSVLLTSNFANIILCKNCASSIDIAEWKGRNFSSMHELLNKKDEVLQKATINNLSLSVVAEIAHYFDEYINAGFVTSIDGKAGQTLKIFSHHCIVTTQSEGKKDNLEDMFCEFDDDDSDDDDELLTSEEKRSLARGLITGNLLQAGIGVAVSATINKQEKEKNAERKSRERHKNIDRLITVGERRINLGGISSIETFSSTNTTNGYLKFVHKGAPRDTLYDCEYFFFNNSIPFKSKKIKQDIETIKDLLTDKIVTIQQETFVAAAQAEHQRAEQQFSQQNKSDVFKEIRKYKQLLDDGIISEEDFNTKKKQLLRL